MPSILRPSVRVISWNTAGANSISFDDWISKVDANDEATMHAFQNFLQDPRNDNRIDSFFSAQMFAELVEEMRCLQMSGLVDLEEAWNSDFRQRKAISGFLQDCSHQHMSMLDRFTSSMVSQSGVALKRPAVINGYDGSSMDCVASWWTLWKNFMFHTQVVAPNLSQHGKGASKLVCELIAVAWGHSEEISVPSQILTLAILDALFVHMINLFAPGSWESVRKGICESVVSKMVPKIILSICDASIIFMQGATSNVIREAARSTEIAEMFAAWPLKEGDCSEGHGFILVARCFYKEESVQDVTHMIAGTMAAPPSRRDFLAASVEDSEGRRWLLALLRGDPACHSTQALLDTLDCIARTTFRGHVLVISLEAGAQAGAPSDLGGLQQFMVERRMVSCAGSSLAAPACGSHTMMDVQQEGKSDGAGCGHEMCWPLQRTPSQWILTYRFQAQCEADDLRDCLDVASIFEDGASHEPIGRDLICARIELSTNPEDDIYGGESNKHIDLARSFARFDLDRLSTGLDAPSLSAFKNVYADLASDRTHTSSRRNLKAVHDLWGIGQVPAAIQNLADYLRRCAPRLPDYYTRLMESEDELSIDQTVQRLQVQHYVDSVTSKQGESLDQLDLDSLGASDPTISVLYCSRPISFICCKPVGFACLAAAAVLYLVEAALNLESVSDFHAHALVGRYFRFTSIETRNGSAMADLAISQPGVSSLGLLLEGCDVDAAANHTAVGPTLMIALAQTVAINGWFFETGVGSVERDPARFAFERSLEGSVWYDVGSPPWVLRSNISRVPLERLARKVVDLRPPWQWLLHWIAGPLILCAGHIGALVCGVLGSGRRAALSIVAAEFIFACINLIVGCHNLMHQEDERAVAPLYFLMFAEVLLRAFVIYTEEHPFGVPLVCGLSLCSFAFGPTIYVERTNYHPNSFSRYVYPCWTVFYFALFALVLTLRALVHKWASARLVAEDRIKFDLLWKDIATLGGGSAEFKKIERSAKLINRNARSAGLRPRQCHGGHQLPPNLSLLSSIGAKLGFYLENQKQSDPTVHGNGGVMQPVVNSIELLFNQATFLDCFLRSKTEELALASCGLLSTCTRTNRETVHGFHHVQDIRRSPEIRVIWAALKSKERALEKMIRSHNNDASYLLDFCRQRIVFKEPAHIALCLDKLQGDDEIEVVRVKNRMNLGHDSKFSAGFRNVIVNLRIQSDYTRRLGIDMHICELQLTLQSFQELTSEEQHVRYLTFRGCRWTPSVWSLIFHRDLDLTSTLVDRRRRMAIGRGSIMPLDGKPDISILIQNPIGPTAGPIAPLALLDGPHEVMSVTNDHYLRPPDGCELAGEEACVHEFESEMQQALDRHLVKSMRSTARGGGGGSAGGSKDHVLKEATLLTPLGSIWDISHPVAAALSKPRALLFIAIIGLVILTNLGLELAAIMEDRFVMGFHVRFTAVELYKSNGTTPPGAPGIIKLGSLLNGCVGHPAANVTVDGPTMTISFHERVSMNGWWYSVHDLPYPDRARRFYVELSDDPLGGQWSLVGSSCQRWGWSGMRILLPDACGPRRPLLDGTTSGAEAVYLHEVVQADMRMPACLAVSKVLHNVVYVWACAALVVAGLRSETLKGRWILATCFGVKALLDACFFVVFVIQGYPNLGFVSGVFTGIFGWLWFVFVNLRLKIYLRHWAFVAGVGQLATLLVHYNVMLRQQLGLLQNLGLFRNEGFTEGILFIIFSVVTSALRHRSRSHAHKIVERDHALYDALWARILGADQAAAAADGGGSAVARLLECSRRVQARCDPDVRQRGREEGPKVCTPTRRFVLNSFGSSVKSVRRKTVDATAPGPAVMDLDQLFAQAAGLNPFLKRKVQQWALQSGGCFPVRRRPSEGDGGPAPLGGGGHGEGGRRGWAFERWEDVVGRPGGVGLVQWAKPKKLQRAVEKLYRVYDCDVSRLLDCCRQSIYYPDLASLARGLEAIAADGEVAVARVNNRLHAGYDSRATAGYRDVSLNLRIVTDHTRALGIETHICELQLILIDVANVKTEEGHKNYVSWRNQRGA